MKTAYRVVVTIHKGGDRLENGQVAAAGAVEAKVEGLTGASCDGLLDALADALDVVTRRHTPARHQGMHVRTKTHIKTGR
jgi:hypothetical protein